MFTLKRHIQTDNLKLSENYASAYDVFSDDDYKSVLDDCTNIYSKIEAIDRLAISMRTSEYDIQQYKIKIRALLSDAELLFPQTRERHYTKTSYSMQLSLQDGKFFSQTAKDMIDGRLSERKRIKCFAQKIYKERFESQEGNEYPLTFEQIMFGLNLILDGKGVPLSEVKLEAGDRGYYLSKEAQKNEWLKDARILFGEERVRVIPDISEQLDYSVDGLFEFCAYILQECIWQEELYQQCRTEGATYTPKINEVQKQQFFDQIQSFQNEKLSEWEKALPAMKQFLSPSIKHGVALGKIRIVDTYVDDLEKAFYNYLLSEHGNIFDTDEKLANKRFAREAASFFLRYNGRENAVFFDQPHIIFYIFRSPCYRSLCRYEDIRWSVKKVIRYACTEFPTPITNASLDMDTKLFKSILEVCDKACKASDVQFCVDQWNSWLVCMQQIVKCLSFMPADLIMVQDGFRKLLKYPTDGYFVLDTLLEKQMVGEKSLSYVSLWRTLLNKYCHPERKYNNRFEESCKGYKTIFKSPMANISSVIKCIAPLCNDIGWNKICFVPTEAEIKAVKRQIDMKTAQEILNSIKGHDVGEENLQMLKLTWMEWTVLQYICEQSRRQLIKCTVQLLSDPRETQMS